jgi:hypothetical protein
VSPQCAADPQLALMQASRAPGVRLLGLACLVQVPCSGQTVRSIETIFPNSPLTARHMHPLNRKGSAAPNRRHVGVH